MNTYNITLGAGGTAGQDPILGLSPTLLVSKRAKERYRVTLTGERFSLKYLPRVHDLVNPPSTPDYKYYTIFEGAIIVRTSTGAIPTQTALQLIGNYVPSIAQVPDELSDNLVDVLVALALETNALDQVMERASSPTSTTTLRDSRRFRFLLPAQNPGQ